MASRAPALKSCLPRCTCALADTRAWLHSVANRRVDHICPSRTYSPAPLGHRLRARRADNQPLVSSSHGRTIELSNGLVPSPPECTASVIMLRPAGPGNLPNAVVGGTFGALGAFADIALEHGKLTVPRRHLPPISHLVDDGASAMGKHPPASPLLPRTTVARAHAHPPCAPAPHLAPHRELNKLAEPSPLPSACSLLHTRRDASSHQHIARVAQAASAASLTRFFLFIPPLTLARSRRLVAWVL